MSEAMTGLRTRLGELEDLKHAAALLGWDQQTMMPPRGGRARAESLATLERIHHEMFTAAETERLLEAAAAELNGTGEESDDARLVSVASRRFRKAKCVPTELAADLARAASLGQEEWIAARAANDYEAFVPALQRQLDLTRRYVDCFDSFDCAYDVLLDDYEPGLKRDHVAELFDELKGELLPMIAQLAPIEIDSSCLHGDFPIATQRRLIAGIVEMMGFEHDRWRLDDAVHPFATSFGHDDVRITNRWDPTFFASALYGAMHECGHGLYEAGVGLPLQRTPLGEVESLGMHESQSRLWENMVGRGRDFAEVLAPRLAQMFPGLADLEPVTLYRAVNHVEPSFIRVEADETTYGLHVIMRFELEQELVDGRLSLADLPEAWNAKVKEYLGIDVPDYANGVLQDVHWSSGGIGYFPTYALGNLIGGELWARVNDDIPDLGAQIAAGELMGLREWLREHVHQHGSKFGTTELLSRVVGRDIEVGPFVSYLKRKLSDVYELDLGG